MPHVIVIAGPNGAGKSTIADTWHVFDNSRESDPQLIATYDRATGIFENNQLLWEQIRGEY